MFPLQLRSAEELPLGARPLAFGCRGGDVRALQLALQAAGYRLEADGLYGYVTEAAVRRFQIRLGLAPDGVAGPGTLARLAAFREGRGYVFHRARPGETAAGIAGLLGVGEEALRRWNGLRRGATIPPGRLLAVPRRVILLLPGEKPPACLAYTSAMGPRLDLLRPEWPAEGAGDLPVLAAGEAAWREFLDHSSGRREAADSLRLLAQSHGVRVVAVEIPPRLWRRRRRLLPALADLRDEGGPALCPLVYRPEPGEPWPDLPALARLSARLLFDPGPSAFDLGSLARLLRRVRAAVPPDHLLVVLRGGGLLSSAEGPEEILSTRAARAEAIAARARWVWDEAAGAFRAVPGREEGPGWRLSLVEERGLRLRVRLADRLGLAGVVLGGLHWLVPPRRGEAPWPGEFSVADNFLPAPHID